mgnify:CR=1 FL=1|tara:strand:- start:213 stop:806 length:594 start_codon:yes stop_codon:yes gene_type:complete
MNKFKTKIFKKKLSWENINNIKKCDYENCIEKGEYKAPKSRLNLNVYYYFCLNHVKEYNKSWNFYKDLSVDEIELSVRKDVVWDRPSWPLKGNPSNILNQISSFLNNDYTLHEKDRDTKHFINNKYYDHGLTIEEQKSLEVLRLKMPINVEKIKKAYKRLVKIFHPDVNKENDEAENKFKEINHGYKILLKKFLKKT